MLESDLISVADAIGIIDAVPVTARVARVQLHEAQGRRVASDVIADRDYPPFNKSLMDGYAVRSADVAAAPVELRVVGEIAAGGALAHPIHPGETVAIMTGAPLPPGADGVVPVENTVRTGDRVRIDNGEAPDRFVMRRGGDCRAGDVVLKAGATLDAAQLAVAASVGAAEVDVFVRPRVAVLSTGDELVTIDQTPGASQIRNSNNLMLAALLTRFGCDVTDMGIARDEPDVIRESLRQGLGFDALVVSGGMSMGQYDYVPRMLLELGVDLRITKLRIKPGKPFVFGVNENPRSFVFGLPGNPVSSFVCCMRLSSRLLLRMGGADGLERRLSARLTDALAPNGVREFYQPAILKADAITPLKWNGSADIYTLAKANAMIIRPENAPPVPAGERVELLEIPS
jgi:molybdopterin molybdotransferase